MNHSELFCGKRWHVFSFLSYGDLKNSENDERLFIRHIYQSSVVCHDITERRKSLNLFSGLWVKCGIAECGMRKVKCGIENAE